MANEPNYQLENELYKPIIRKFEKRKVYSCFRDNIWGINWADIQALSKSNMGNKYLFSAIDLFSKNVWVIPMKTKKELVFLMHFKKEFHKEGNQIKYRLFKEVNFVIIILKTFWK